MFTSDQLKTRFVTLWSRSAIADITPVDAVWHEIESRHGEFHRHYHTLAHIGHCLTQIDSLDQATPHRDAIELAIWFHDVIFDIGSKDNEERSMAFFREQSRDRLPSPLVEHVSGLILATRHMALEDDPTARYVVDVDLSSFGLPWAAFLKDSMALRMEDVLLDDAPYYTAKQSFLEGLLARPRMYQTDHFYERHETQARANISRYLKEYCLPALGSS
jgi:predicted metal-dependent HD superfamily phosphohydrolase